MAKVLFDGFGSVQQKNQFSVLSSRGEPVLLVRFQPRTGTLPRFHGPDEEILEISCLLDHVPFRKKISRFIRSKAGRSIPWS